MIARSQLEVRELPGGPDIKLLPYDRGLSVQIFRRTIFGSVGGDLDRWDHVVAVTSLCSCLSVCSSQCDMNEYILVIYFSEQHKWLICFKGLR